MGSYHEHQELIKRFKIDIQQEIKGIRIFDRHVGKFLTMRAVKDISNWKHHIVSINKKGMADCYALYNNGQTLIHLEFEFKSGNARQTKEQKIWQKFIENNNGIYKVIREDYHQSILEIKKALIT